MTSRKRQERPRSPGTAVIAAGVALVAAIATTARAAEPEPQRLALVIANSAYTAQPALPACQLSANLVAAALARAGFRVTPLANPSNARTGAAIAAIGDEVSAAPGSRSVIYVCGYVAPLAERLFLLPVEARLDRPTDLLTQGIVARLPMASVAAPGTAAGLVLLDAATAPPADVGPSLASVLRPGDDPHAGLVAVLLPAGTDGPSPLANAFADILREPRVELSRLVTELPASLSAARAQVLAARAPSTASWLVGGPEPAASEPAEAAPARPASPTLTPPTPAPASAAAPPAPAPIGTPPGPAALNPAERRRVQLGLQRLGYYRGPVDGVFATDTAAAIRRFQQDSGKPVTGRLMQDEAAQLLGS